MPKCADGNIKGGNKFSNMKAMVAQAEKSAQSEILKVLIFFIFHPAIGGTSCSPKSGTILRLCGAQ